MARAREILQSVRPESMASSSRVRPMDWFNCTMDFIALVLDWTGVVLARGAPVLNLLTCGWAITWAVADTIHEVQAISSDC